MKSSWREYKIGNALRGEIHFKARSLLEAWERGCKLFNEMAPSEGMVGRWITLEEFKKGKEVPTTQWVINQMSLPENERYFSNTEFETGDGWITVASGMSKEKLITEP